MLFTGEIIFSGLTKKAKPKKGPKILTDQQRLARNAYAREYYHRMHAMDVLYRERKAPAENSAVATDRGIPETEIVLIHQLQCGWVRRYRCGCCRHVFISSMREEEGIECPYCWATAVEQAPKYSILKVEKKKSDDILDF